MFLKKSRLKLYPMKRLWPASSKLQSEIYGERLNDILNANASKDADINVKDGVCIESKTEVTHRVISKKAYSQHQVLELERVRFNRSR